MLYAVGAYSAETLTDILALVAGMVQSLINIVNLNNYPSVYFNLCRNYISIIVPIYSRPTNLLKVRFFIYPLLPPPPPSPQTPDAAMP